MPAPNFQAPVHPQQGYPYPPSPFQAPMLPPPGQFFAPPPPRREGGVGRAILLTILILALSVSVLINLVVFAGGDEEGGAARYILSSGDASQKVAVVPIRGIIETNAANLFDQFLDLIEKDKSVKALVVEIDSPGGTVTASDEIYERIRRFKANRNIPVVVSMGSMATSGGYYAACGADYIFAQPTTITGNIGVLSPRLNFAKLMEKYGVEDSTVVATGSTFKNAGSMFSKETPEQRAYWQGLIDQAYDRFKHVVEKGRGAKLKGNMADIANGKAYTAEEAFALGLVDNAKGYPEDAHKYAAATAGLSNPSIVRYERPVSALERLLSSQSGTPPVGASGGRGGINVNIDAALLEQLATPRLLYLWSEF